MDKSRAISFPVLLLALAALLPAADPQTAIAKVLTDQAAAWNRGDLTAFAASYGDHCTLIGTSSITEATRAQVMDHFQKKYSSRAAMGRLTFSNLQIHPLDDRFATATGNWHLERTASAGGNTGGVFSLVLALVNGSWQVVMDHTST